MEACWIDAIFLGLAMLGLFQVHSPLMPLWVPFLVIAGSQWLYNWLVLRAAQSHGQGEKSGEDFADISIAPWFVPLLIVVALFTIWLSIYMPTAFVLDPRWLLTMLSDILVPQCAGIPYNRDYCSLRLFLLAWHSPFWSRVEPSQIFATMRLGIGVILAVIVIRAASAGGGVALPSEVTCSCSFPFSSFSACPRMHWRVSVLYVTCINSTPKPTLMPRNVLSSSSLACWVLFCCCLLDC